jgi:hypothetical protein
MGTISVPSAGCSIIQFQLTSILRMILRDKKNGLTISLLTFGIQVWSSSSLAAEQATVGENQMM